MTDEAEIRSAEEIWTMLERLSRELALTKQRLTRLEQIVEVLEPPSSGSNYKALLARADDGTAVASIGILQEGRISASVLVPLREDTPPLNSFLIPYLEARKVDGLVTGYSIRSSVDGTLRTIIVWICTDDEVRSVVVKELLGKLRWTLAKMYANVRGQGREAERAEALRPQLRQGVPT